MKIARIQWLVIWSLWVLILFAVCSCSGRDSLGLVSCRTLGTDLHRFFSAAQIEAHYGLPASAYGDRVVLWPDSPPTPVRVMIYACEECPQSRVVVYATLEDAHIAGWTLDGPTLTRACPGDGGVQ